MKDRIIWVDWIKAIGIWLVVLGHMPMTNTTFHNVIYSFHMPLFFFVSGFLYKYDPNIKRCLSKNFWRLIAVGVSYLIIEIPWGCIMDLIFYRSQFSLEHNVISPICERLLYTSKTGPLWFLCALFLMKIWYNILDYFNAIFFKINDLIWELTVFVLSVSIGLFVYYTSCSFNYYQLTAFLYGFPFFVVGVIFKQNNFPKYFRHYYMIALMIILYLLTLPVGKISMNGLYFEEGVLVFYIRAFVGILALMSLFLMFDKCPSWIRTISNGTLPILALHMFFLQIYKIFYKLVFNITAPPPYMDIAGAIVGATGIIVLMYYPVRKALSSENVVMRFMTGKGW